MGKNAKYYSGIPRREGGSVIIDCPVLHAKDINNNSAKHFALFYNNLKQKRLPVVTPLVAWRVAHIAK